jgi:hypothetical protein
MIHLREYNSSHHDQSGNEVTYRRFIVQTFQNTVNRTAAFSLNEDRFNFFTSTYQALWSQACGSILTQYTGN